MELPHSTASDKHGIGKRRQDSRLLSVMPEVLLRRHAGECPEVSTEVRLIIVPAFLTDRTPGAVAEVLVGEHRLESGDPQEGLGSQPKYDLEQSLHLPR